MMKKGFTIVELLMVIGIIGILLTIVTTAAATSIKASRERKAEALCTLVESGISTYYAQKGKWPGNVGDFSGMSGGMDIGGDGENSGSRASYELSGNEVRAAVKDLVEATRQGSPVIDVSGLFVSRDPGESNGKGFGLDFMQAVKGTRNSRDKMKLAEMYFGYPEREHGYFRRFRMRYNFESDYITVTR